MDTVTLLSGQNPMLFLELWSILPMMSFVFYIFFFPCSWAIANSQVIFSPIWKTTGRLQTISMRLKSKETNFCFWLKPLDHSYKLLQQGLFSDGINWNQAACEYYVVTITASIHHCTRRGCHQPVHKVKDPPFLSRVYHCMSDSC